MRTLRSRRIALVGVLVLVGSLGSAAVSHSDPVTDDDVERAQAAVRTTAQSVAAIEVELAAQSVQLDESWQAVAIAAEDYTEALVATEAAEDDAVAAAERAAAAEAEVETARAELGRIALEAHRSGGSLDEVAVLIAADGMEDYVARSTAIGRLGAQADRAVQRFEAAELVAGILAERAEEARLEAAAAARSAEDLLTRAEDLHADAEAEVARVAAARESLIVELAELRRTSVEVERARQEALDAERAARAGAGNRPAAPPADPGSGEPSDGGSRSGSSNPPQNPPGTSGPTPPPSSTPTPTPTPTPTSPPPASDPYGLGTGTQRGSAAQGQAAVEWARAQVGKPYLYGGAGPDAFDCSGLTMRAWQAAGVSINRTSRDQYRQVLKISYDSMRPGDLIFWGTNPSDPGSVYHVAMFVGGGQMVESPSPGNPVRVTSIRWGNTMPYAGRP